MYIQFVLAQQKDCHLLLQWANDIDVRKNSFHTKPVLYEEHVKWFKDKLDSDQSYIYICYLYKKPIGQIRIDFEEDIGWIDYSIAKEYRGKGYGTKILKEIIDKIQVNCIKIKKLTGKVKFTNIPSQRAFEKAGYDFIKRQEYIEYYKYLNL